MTVLVCSGFSPAGRKEYGESFLRTFDKFWPKSVELRVYVEDPTPMPRDAYRLLWNIPGAREFHLQHANNADCQGRVPHGNWKDAEKSKGYSFRHDAYKFWKQMLIPNQAAKELQEGDVLCWLDADVETTAPVPEGEIERLLGDAEVCYLGRARQHSEIGFWAVRINPQTRAFLDNIAKMYTTGEVFGLSEWHSAFVWDHVRNGMRLKERNLCGPQAHGHVWPQSPLARWSVHHKGPRKGLIHG